MHVPPPVAAFIYIVGIAGLFWFDQDPDARPSRALWIPTIWLLITGSRPLSMWLGMSPTASLADIYLEGSPIDRFFFLALLTAGLIVLVRRADRVEPLLKKNGPILLFFCYAALSILWSEFPFVAFKHWIKGIGDVVLVLIIVTEPDLVGGLKRLFSRVGFLLVPLSMLFCKYYPNLGRHLSRSWTMEYTGVTTQKNTLGALCVVLGLGFLWRFLETFKDRDDPCRTRRLTAYGTILLMVLWLLWTSKSMTCTSCLIMGSAIMILANRPSSASRPALLHALVLVMIGLSVVALFFDPGGGLVGMLGRDPTLTGRTKIWEVVLQFAGNPWVGTGYESFWLGERMNKIWEAFNNFYVNEAHNGYLEIYINLGWIGILFLTVVIATGYRKVMFALRINPGLAGLALGWFITAIVRGLTEAAFRMCSISWIFFLLGIITATQIAYQEELFAWAQEDEGNPTTDENEADSIVAAGAGYG